VVLALVSEVLEPQKGVEQALLLGLLADVKHLKRKGRKGRAGEELGLIINR
jgi:hypothetical protein